MTPQNLPEIPTIPQPPQGRSSLDTSNAHQEQKKPHINENYFFHKEGYGHLNENIRTSLFGRHMLSWW